MTLLKWFGELNVSHVIIYTTTREIQHRSEIKGRI